MIVFISFCNLLSGFKMLDEPWRTRLTSVPSGAQPNILEYIRDFYFTT
jgi:hypothetical protein